MARIIADALGGELDVVLVHKLGAPGHAELAIGAVDESGNVTLDGRPEDYGIPASYVEAERQAQVEALRRRRALYTQARRPADPAGRVTIVVDNGIATGATLIAALRSVRARKPASLIAAAAVAPPSVVSRLRAEADEVVCLATPEAFGAVGFYFRDFSQVSDEEVTRALGSPASRSEPDGRTP
jgi:putative phosphoribosyl transferase